MIFWYGTEGEWEGTVWGDFHRGTSHHTRLTREEL